MFALSFHCFYYSPQIEYYNAIITWSRPRVHRNVPHECALYRVFDLTIITECPQVQYCTRFKLSLWRVNCFGDTAAPVQFSEISENVSLLSQRCVVRYYYIIVLRWKLRRPKSTDVANRNHAQITIAAGILWTGHFHPDLISIQKYYYYY